MAMNTQNKNQALLPSGFEDLLFPEAGHEARAISALMEKFESFGYERIKPPFVEFRLKNWGIRFGFGPHVLAQLDPFPVGLILLRERKFRWFPFECSRFDWGKAMAGHFVDCLLIDSDERDLAKPSRDRERMPNHLN